jgi:hypothetical protein
MKVRNLTGKRSHLRSADGDSVLVMPNSVATVDDKFNWQLNPREFTVLADKTNTDVPSDTIAQPAVPTTLQRGEVGPTVEGLQTSRGNGAGVAKSTTIRA